MHMNLANKRIFVLYVICSFVIIGLSHSQNMPLSLQSESLFTGNYTAGVVANDYLYIASDFGITVYNVTSLSNPNFVSRFGTSGNAYDVAKFSDYLFVADGYNGLVILNVANPASPTLVSTTVLDGIARALDVSDNGQACYIALENGGLTYLNVSNPASPTIVTNHPTVSQSFGVDWEGGYVYLVTEDEFYSLNPTTLSEIQTYALPGVGRDVLVHNNIIYVADKTQGVHRFSVGVSGVFTFLGTSPVFNAVALSSIGNNIAVARRTEGMSIINNTGNILASFTGIPTGSSADGVCAVGTDNIYIGEGNYGFQLTSASPPITVFSTVDISGGPRNSVVSGDYAYVANYSDGVKVLNISNPSTPTVITTLNAQFTHDPFWVYDVEVIGNRLFVVEFFSGVYSYDITNPANPQYLTTFTIPTAGSRACAADGTHLYVVHYENGLYKFDTNLAQVGTVQGTLGEPRDIKVDSVNHLAFVADYTNNASSGAMIFDISGITPVWRSTYAMTKTRAIAFISDGTYKNLFVGSESEGMDIVNYTNPQNPVFVASYATRGDVDGLTVDTAPYKYVYAADWDMGLEAIYVGAPSTPVSAGYYDTHSLCKADYVIGNYLHVSDSYSYYIFKLGGETTVSMPVLTANANSTITVPISTSAINTLNVTSFTTQIAVNTSSLTYNSYTTTGTLTAGWSLTPSWNASTGILTLSGTGPAAGPGTVLINVVFNTLSGSSPLIFNSFTYNLGRPSASTTNGSVTIGVPNYNISGNINYYSAAAPAVPGTIVTLAGPTTFTQTTNTAGAYNFLNVPGNQNYVSTPAKTEVVHNPSITLADAVLVMQGSIGLADLTPNQIIAGNVSLPAGVSFFDASNIALYVVGIVDRFEAAINANSDWAFVPANRNYSPLSANQTNQNFTGVLYGDVNMSWPGSGVSSNPAADNSIIGTVTQTEDEVTIPVHVNNVHAFFFQGEMTYDPDNLEFKEIQLTSLPNGWLLVNNSDEEGIVRFGACNAYELGSEGDVVTITFNILNNQVGTEIKIKNFFTDDNSPRYSAGYLVVPNGVPTSYSLHQNFPNPFNSETNIRFDIKERGNVTLIVYNAIGQRVRLLVNEIRNPGAYTASFDGYDDRGIACSSGLYFYQVQCNDFSDTKKMIMVK